jgi:short-chain fatty acids transporter
MTSVLRVQGRGLERLQTAGGGSASIPAVAAAALVNGAGPAAIATSFGEGFWSLITFTMQMAMIVIAGYSVASSPVVARLIDTLAAIPLVPIAIAASVSMLISLLHWAMALIFSALLVCALARRNGLQMDYRAADAAGRWQWHHLGLGVEFIGSPIASQSSELAKIVACLTVNQMAYLAVVFGRSSGQADKEPGQRGNNDVAGKPGQQQEAPSCFT